jgi:ATP-binding cassette subfamily B protein
MSATATRTSELRRRLRATGGRGRKLRGLAGLLAPYRWRVGAMFLSIVVATACALAPAPLAKLAIDNGIKHHDVGALDLIVVAFLVSAIVYAIATYLQTYLVGWVSARCRTCACSCSVTCRTSRSASTRATAPGSSSPASPTTSRLSTSS